MSSFPSNAPPHVSNGESYSSTPNVQVQQSNMPHYPSTPSKMNDRLSNLPFPSAATMAPPRMAAKTSTDGKKGELHDLQQLLRQVKSEKEPSKRRDALKRVISYMTVGIDVSCLFSEMVMIASTSNLVEKKMVYLYLTSYAESNPDLALLTINTLRVDASHDDPHVRALALRSLCSLKLLNMTEYLDTELNHALKDKSAYVRGTAVIGCLKLFKINPSFVKGTSLMQTLHFLLRDKDAHVVRNVIVVLNEIYAQEGGWHFTKELVHYLLIRIKEFDEWGQCIVLNFISSYKPSDEDEMYRIMDILDDLLKNSSSAVSMSCMKCFINMTIDKGQYFYYVVQRLKTPLITLMSISQPEAAYVILLHISLLIAKGGSGVASVFELDYKSFFCRFNDPSYIKTIRIELLAKIASHDNAKAIYTEIMEYVKDISPTISKCAIHAVRNIAIHIPSAMNGILKELVLLLTLDIDYITAMTLCALKDLLRKYSGVYEEIQSVLENKYWKTLTDSKGLCAIIWMIGEFGEHIEDACYILEDFVDRDEEDPMIKLELLTACMKLFFKRPSEMQPILGWVLKKMIQDTSVPDVHDRALFYYRFLTEDAKQCRNMFVNNPKETIEEFEEERPTDVDHIFSEFNTLSVVYGQPSSHFLKSAPISECGIMPSTTIDIHPLNTAVDTSNTSLCRSNSSPTFSSLLEFEEDAVTLNLPTTSLNDLFFLDAATKDEPIEGVTHSFCLVKPISIDSNTFQKKWNSQKSTHCFQFVIAQLRFYPYEDPLSLSRIEELLTSHNFEIIASGSPLLESTILYKLYAYAEDWKRYSYYVEIVVNLTTLLLDVKLRSQSNALIKEFQAYLTDIFRPLIQVS